MVMIYVFLLSLGIVSIFVIFSNTFIAHFLILILSNKSFFYLAKHSNYLLLYIFKYFF